MYSLRLCLMLALCVGLSRQQEDRSTTQAPPRTTRSPPDGLGRDRPGMGPDMDMAQRSCGRSQRKGSDLKRMVRDAAQDMVFGMVMPWMMGGGGQGMMGGGQGMMGGGGGGGRMGGCNGGMMGGGQGMMGGGQGMMGGGQGMMGGGGGMGFLGALLGSMMGGGRDRDYDRRMMDDDCDDRGTMSYRRAGCRESRDPNPRPKPPPKPKMHIPCEIENGTSKVERPCAREAECKVGPVEAQGFTFKFCSVRQCPNMVQLKEMAEMKKAMGMGGDDMDGSGDDMYGSRDDMDGSRDDMYGSRDDMYGSRDDMDGSRDDMYGSGDGMDHGTGEMDAEKKFVKDIFKKYLEFFREKGCFMDLPDDMGDMDGRHDGK